MEQVFEQIGAPERKATLNSTQALNSDIIKALNSSFKDAVRQTKKIAQSFEGSNPAQTCLNIWEFLRNDIQYKKDPEGLQLIRQPRAFLEARTGDCKSFSLFAAAVLKNIYPNAKVFLRYAAYGSLNIPTHVYCVVQTGNKKIICDGVYKYAGKEKKYTYKQDYEMKVYTLSGLETETINGKGRLKAALQAAVKNVTSTTQAAVKNVTSTAQTAATSVKNAVTPQQKAATSAPKKLKDKVKGIIKKVVKGGKTVGFAPSRAAFLGLVAANVRGLATKIATSIKQHPEKVKNIWVKLGGDFSQLTKTANNGAKRKRILGIEGIGEPVTASTAVTALAAAAPVIALFVGLFKKLKGTDATDTDTQFLDNISTDTLNAEGTSVREVADAANTEEFGDGTSTGSNKTLLYGGLGLLALLALGGGKKLFK